MLIAGGGEEEHSETGPRSTDRYICRFRVLSVGNRVSLPMVSASVPHDISKLNLGCLSDPASKQYLELKQPQNISKRLSARYTHFRALNGACCLETLDKAIIEGNKRLSSISCNIESLKTTKTGEDFEVLAMAGIRLLWPPRERPDAVYCTT